MRAAVGLRLGDTEAKTIAAARATSKEVADKAKRGGDRRSEEAQSKCNFHFDNQCDRASQNGLSRRTQMKLDRIARERPDLRERIIAAHRRGAYSALRPASGGESGRINIHR
jgi:hypothetical protein